MVAYNAWCDGSYSNFGGSIGYIIRTTKGELVVKQSQKLANCTNSIDAEYESLLFLLKRIKKLGLSNINIYMDCASVVDTVINGIRKKSTRKKYLKKYDEIHQLLSNIQSAKINKTLREYNGEADFLSKPKHIRDQVKPTVDKLSENFKKRSSMYNVPNYIRNEYKKLCQKSTSRCKTDNEIDMRIIRAANLGARNYKAKGCIVVRYFDLQLLIENGTIVNIERNSDPKKYYPVHQAVRDKWFELVNKAI